MSLNITTHTTAQRSAAVEIANAIYMEFLEHLLQVSLNECQQVVVFDVGEMSAAGKAKVCHVGRSKKHWRSCEDT